MYNKNTAPDKMISPYCELLVINRRLRNTNKSSERLMKKALSTEKYRPRKLLLTAGSERRNIAHIVSNLSA